MSPIFVAITKAYGDEQSNKKYGEMIKVLYDKINNLNGLEIFDK